MYFATAINNTKKLRGNKKHKKIEKSAQLVHLLCKSTVDIKVQNVRFS
jgi:hypothetical protein